MDWIVFGDDWGRHVSTIQHLVRSFPASDRVVWVDSIGMRTPRLTGTDLRRVAGKLLAMAGAQPNYLDRRRPPRTRFRVVKPLAVPFHLSAAAVAFNRLSLRAAIMRQAAALGMTSPVVLTMNPVATLYLDALDPSVVVYLRQDAYRAFPGMEARLIDAVEPPCISRADLVFATSRTLLPKGADAPKGHYLPQGVDLAHFARVPLEPPEGEPVVGFYGSVAEWLDAELIAESARLCPEWRFELIGPVKVAHPQLARVPNVATVGPCPYVSLPERIARWSAAWLPFRMTEQIKNANSLKLREYLAAGLPTASVPFPEATSASAYVRLVTHPGEVAAWLSEVRGEDSPQARRARRESVADQAWSARAAHLRRLVAERA